MTETDIIRRNRLQYAEDAEADADDYCAEAIRAMREGNGPLYVEAIAAAQYCRIAARLAREAAAYA